MIYENCRLTNGDKKFVATIKKIQQDLFVINVTNIIVNNKSTVLNNIYLAMKRNIFSCSDEEPKLLKINLTSHKIASLPLQRETLCCKKLSNLIPSSYLFGEPYTTAPTIIFDYCLGNDVYGKLHLFGSHCAEMMNKSGWDHGHDYHL